MQWQQDTYVITTDKSQLDISLIYDYLSNSYWAKGIPRETLEAAVSGAMCFGLYDNCSVNGQKSPAQIGFTALKMPERFMELHNPDVYKNQ